MFDDRSRAEIEDDRQAAFGERVIKQILANAGVKNRLREWKRQVSWKTGKMGLTFDWFHEFFPDFPVRMGAAKLTYIHDISVPNLFGAGFVKMKFFLEYRDHLLRENLDDRTDRAGLAFMWPGIGIMVLHNYPVGDEAETSPDPDIRTERGTRIVRPFGNPLVIYVVERLDDFLRNIGTEWAAI